MAVEVAGRRTEFAELHEDGLFVLPNAWGVGPAKLLAWLGVPAIATTSAGHASIEDYDPVSGAIDLLEVAVERR